jgi:hypothetical protein
MEEHRARESQAELDTAAKLDTMAQRMRNRAGALQMAVQDARSFEKMLSVDQKTIFDLFWKSQGRWHVRHRGAV